MEKTRVSLNNTNRPEGGIYNNKFPNDGSHIDVSGKKRILIYSVSANGLLEVVFNGLAETAIIQGENNSIDIPEDCQGISFQLADHDYCIAKFVFEVI